MECFFKVVAFDDSMCGILCTSRLFSFFPELMKNNKPFWGISRPAWLLLAGCLAFVFTLHSLGYYLLAESDSSESATNSVPVIYTTDLFHPHGDMDDQVDLAVIYALSELDVRLIVLDNHEAQAERPGNIPVRQLNHIAKRTLQPVTGLAHKLKSLEDTALDQDEAGQEGVKAILDVLKKSQKKVTIVTVGSLRDVAAAYNRSPELFQDKISKIMIFAGEASRQGFSETNVKLDRYGFARMMMSGLPIYWLPCFDGGRWSNEGNSTYWLTRYKDILGQASDPLLNYMIYSAKRSGEDPIASLDGEVDRQFLGRFQNLKRNLWGAAAFLAINDQVIVQEGRSFSIMPVQTAPEEQALFSFEPVHVLVSEEGVVSYAGSGEGAVVHRFRVNRPKEYAEGMTRITARLLGNL